MFGNGAADELWSHCVSQVSGENNYYAWRNASDGFNNCLWSMFGCVWMCLSSSMKFKAVLFQRKRASKRAELIMERDSKCHILRSRRLATFKLCRFHVMKLFLYLFFWGKSLNSVTFYLRNESRNWKKTDEKKENWICSTGGTRWRLLYSSEPSWSHSFVVLWAYNVKCDCQKAEFGVISLLY